MIAAEIGKTEKTRVELHVTTLVYNSGNCQKNEDQVIAWIDNTSPDGRV